MDCRNCHGPGPLGEERCPVWVCDGPVDYTIAKYSVDRAPDIEPSFYVMKQHHMLGQILCVRVRTSDLMPRGSR